MISILQTKKLRLKRVRIETEDCLTPEFISLLSLLNCLIYKRAGSGTRIQISAPLLTSCAILGKLQKTKTKNPLCLSFLVCKMGIIIMFHRAVWVWWADACYMLAPLPEGQEVLRRGQL